MDEVARQPASKGQERVNAQDESSAGTLKAVGSCAEPTWREEDRLAALERYGILDTGREGSFDDVAALVAELLEAPMAVVNLIASDRQWFKAEVGIGTDSLPLDVSICRHAILQPGVMVVPDLRDDPRFAGNPLIHVNGGLRFYAGALLQTPDGLPLGTLCVLDREPRPTGITPRQERALSVLASQVMVQIELRRAKEEAQGAYDRQSFLLTLEEQLRNLAGPEEIMAAALALLGERLGLDRVGYTEIVDGTTVRMTGCFVANGTAPLTGEFSLESFGKKSIARQRKGITEACDDVQADPDQDDEVWAVIDTRSFASIPLVREGEFRASLYANSRTPRHWTPEDIQLIEEVAGRTWDAVERARSEAALRESEARLRIVQEAGGIGSFDYDLQKDDAVCSPEYYAIFGLPEGHPINRETWAAAIHPDDMHLALDALDRAIAERVPFDYEYRIVRADNGQVRWLAGRAAILFDTQGQPWRYVGGNIDISERKEAEAALAEQEKELRTLTDALPVLVSYIDKERRYRFNNKIYETWFPRRREDIVGKLVREVVGEAAYAKAAPYMDAALRGERVTFDQFMPYADTAGRHIEVEYIPRQAADGSVEGFYTLVQDVTARKTAEEALRQSEEMLRLATEAADVGLWDVDPLGDQLFWPTRVKAMFGIFEDRPVSMTDFYAGLHPDDRAATTDAFASALDPERRALYEVEYRTIGKEDGLVRWVAAKGRGLFDEKSRCTRVIGTAIDITARKAAEEQLRELNETLEERVRERTAELEAVHEALRQSQKMEAVGQLTGGLAHDFNNLLAAISGSLELMATRITQGRLGDVERYMIAAQGASRRAAALTHRLLAFSRRQTLAPKVTDVNALVTGMEELIRRTVGPQVAVECVTASGVWPVEIDPNQLENALLNLAINARDAMPDGGRITIETANRWMDARAARKQELSPGQYVSLCVSDTGAGMPADVVARAFDPFFTTKPLGVGTGLGLSMVYGFARQSGGQVRIYSEVGQGTTVCLYLPRHLGEVDGTEADESGAPAVGPAQAGEAVLVIDDEPVVRMLIVDILEDLGYTAMEANDGAEGLKVLQSKARVDLLITDVGLPGGLNGRQVADAARVLRPDLKVLFVTGYAENAVLNNGHLDSGMHVVTKPFAVDELGRRIRSILLDS